MQVTQELAWRQDKINKAASRAPPACPPARPPAAQRDRTAAGVRCWLHWEFLNPFFASSVCPAAAEKGAQLADGFGNPIRVRLGRLDATEPAPAGRLPAKDASLEEVQVGGWVGGHCCCWVLLLLLRLLAQVFDAGACGDAGDVVQHRAAAGPASRLPPSCARPCRSNSSSSWAPSLSSCRAGPSAARSRPSGSASRCVEAEAGANGHASTVV